jgi:hypothetical protein
MAKWVNKGKMTVGPIESMAACSAFLRELGYKPSSFEFNDDEPCHFIVTAVSPSGKGATRMLMSDFGTPKIKEVLVQVGPA